MNIAPRVLILPAFDEADRLGAVLADVVRANIGCDVVVIDDGSRDATARVARESGATLLRHPFNLGYGAALQTGYKYALARGASLLVQMDADGQHDPQEIRELMAPIERGECDLVVGSRFVAPTDYRMGWLRGIGRRVFASLARLAGLRVSDPTSGFQAMNRRVLEFYASDFFPTDYPDVDVLVAAFRHGLRVVERPVHMKTGTRNSTLHGGLRSFYYVYKMLLSTWSAPSGRPRRGSPGGAR
jgi:glycosyltransferase involved in cell wall biosynthesis